MPHCPFGSPHAKFSYVVSLSLRNPNRPPSYSPAAMSTDMHSNGPSENPNGLSAKPNISSSKKDNGVDANRNRGYRDGNQLLPSAAKRTKPSEGSGKKSQSDLEELVAQTYARGISILHQKHHDNDARRSKSKQKKPEKLSAQKKLPQTWSAEDETSLVNVLLACAGGRGGQVNMATFYEKAKEALGFDISNTQLYDKMRRMRSRFWTIHSKISEGNVHEDKFPYRSSHEAALFKVWKQIWGNNVIEHNEEEVLHNTDPLPSQSNGDYFIGDEDHKPNESRVSVVENMMEDVPLEIGTLIDRMYRRISAGANLELFSARFGALIRTGTGRCVCSTLSGRMQELIEAVRSVKEFPWLGKAEARVLQKKWHTQRVEELRVFYRRLELLQEECKLCLKVLKNENSRMQIVSATSTL